MSTAETIEILEPRRWTTADPATGQKSNYAGDTVDGYTIATQTRDSDALVRSNFQVIAKDMGDACEIHRTGHWACGWVEWLILPTNASEEDKAKAAQWLEDLDQYPVANDDHFSELEYTEAAEYWEHASLKGRMELCERHNVSIFAARRDDMPDTPTGELCTY